MRRLELVAAGPAVEPDARTDDEADAVGGAGVGAAGRETVGRTGDIASGSGDRLRLVVGVLKAGPSVRLGIAVAGADVAALSGIKEPASGAAGGTFEVLADRGRTTSTCTLPGPTSSLSASAIFPTRDSACDTCSRRSMGSISSSSSGSGVNTNRGNCLLPSSPPCTGEPGIDSSSSSTCSPTVVPPPCP